MLPLTEPVVVPGKLTLVTPTLSLATTEKVTVLFWEFEYNSTTLLRSEVLISFWGSPHLSLAGDVISLVELGSKKSTRFQPIGFPQT